MQKKTAIALDQRADLDFAYCDMARDEAREADALEWSEALLSDAFAER